MTKETAANAAKIPQVDKILRHPLVEKKSKQIRQEILVQVIRRRLAHYRESGQVPDSIDEIAGEIVLAADRLLTGGLRKVLNGTGVILNTNLGRAPVAESVCTKLTEVLTGYSSLEINLKTGKRGERTAFIEELLNYLIGSEAAIVVNNNAAAVLLAVNSLSQGREVIISRGELIEIGGSFRLPDVIVSAGGILREVGTTNRTRIEDYRKALNAQTAILLKCHKSNFEITGFTEETQLADLVTLSRESGAALIEDLGSGALIDLTILGLNHETTVDSVIKEGADLVLFSCDKLLGGVQAGVIAGKKDAVEKLRKNPIYRALRADKMIIGLLENVFLQYLSPDAVSLIPALKMASQTQSELQERARNFVRAMNETLKVMTLKEAALSSAFGGGTLPGQALPSWGVQIEIRNDADSSKRISADKLASLLRQLQQAHPVVCIVTDNCVMLDLRTVQPWEEKLLSDSLHCADQFLIKNC